MSTRVEANIRAELLVWARENAGLELETAARKLVVKPVRLSSWEKGVARPTVKQLRKLARVYRRPLAIFYLPEPPLDFKPMHDYRRIYGEQIVIPSPELLYQIRRAFNRREIALELFALDERPVTEFALTADLNDDPETCAISTRKKLGVLFEDQITWDPGYDSFNHWRGILENSGVLVFQIKGVEPKETRGFSIAESPLPVIAVNIKDQPNARVFTLLHELCHIMLRKGGLCDLDEHDGRGFEEQRVEVYCNRFAGAMLVPTELLQNDETVQSKTARSSWTDDEIQDVAHRFAVSREVLLRRLLIGGYVTERFYQEKRQQLQKEYERFIEKREGGFAPPYRVSIGTAGPLFVKLVLDNLYQDKITISDVSDFLDIRLKHLSKIEEAMQSRMVS